ncbi:MAG: caspase family protein [Flavobacteriaceae bacterium]
MKGLALIVGNANYEKSENNLKNPINDARDFADVLSRLGYIVKCVTDINQQDLDAEIDDFSKVDFPIGFEISKND